MPVVSGSALLALRPTTATPASLSTPSRLPVMRRPSGSSAASAVEPVTAAIVVTSVAWSTATAWLWRTPVRTVASRVSPATGLALAEVVAKPLAVLRRRRSASSTARGRWRSGVSSSERKRIETPVAATRSSRPAAAAATTTGCFDREGAAIGSGSGAAPLAPSSDGWRHRRSSGGSGGRFDSASSSPHSLRSTEAQDSERSLRGGRDPRPAVPCRPWCPRSRATAGSRSPPTSCLSARPTTGPSCPGCGAVVLFSGTVRDHADGRTDVTHLEYEAYEEQVVPRLEAIAHGDPPALADDRPRSCCSTGSGGWRSASRRCWSSCPRHTAPRRSPRPASASTR